MPWAEPKKAALKTSQLTMAPLDGHTASPGDKTGLKQNSSSLRIQKSSLAQTKRKGRGFLSDPPGSGEL